MASSFSSSFSSSSLTLSSLLLLLVLIQSNQATRTNRPVIFNFGDSNSDTGGLVAGLGFTVNLPNGRSFFRRSTGRLSDGRLVLDFLCQSLNTTLLRPYLDSLSGAKFSSGANFAVVGSTTLPKFVPFSLNIQTMQFMHFKARTLELLKSDMVRDLISEDEFVKALYMIDIGQNDIADSFEKNMSFVEVVKSIPQVVSQIRIAIQFLYDEGGRNFWVHNTGPLGCLPQKLSLVKTSDFDSHGCIASFNDAAKLFNEELRRVLDRTRTELKDTKIVYVDIYSIKTDLIANATKHGFSSPLMSCCGHGGPPYNYALGSTCGHPGCQVCDEGLKFVSWDGIHLTEAANSFIASKILSGNYSTPSVGFDFFCTN